MKTPLIVEPHIHGAYGVDFNTAIVDDIVQLIPKLKSLGIGYVFPTLVTDSVKNIKRQIKVIKDASKLCPEIVGVHLEGIFINEAKKGIHNSEHFLPLTKENYQKIEDDFIKIVTLAPELDIDLIDYLKSNNVKVQAGHCISGDLSKVNGVTHLFNAMEGVTHRKPSTALSALIDDKIYTEIIADGVHVSDDALKLLFKSKPQDKIILISDALPITHSEIKETTFADSKIYYDGQKATSIDGTIAGSTKLLPEICKILIEKNIFNPVYLENTYKYLNLVPKGEIIWDNQGNKTDIVYV